MSKLLITSLVVGFALVCAGPTDFAAADCMWGCCVRPACGKVCKLVCEEKKLTVVGYGSECKDICVSGPSREGCKHCCVKCCGEGACGDGACGCGECGVCDHCSGRCGPCCPNCQPEAAKLEFCWRDWMPCGCGKPRTIRVLTKYQSEKKICWYHWEVVDACACEELEHSTDNAAPGCPCVYKPAPAESRIGDVFELNDEERTQLATWAPAVDATDKAVMNADGVEPAAEATEASATGEAGHDDGGLSMWKRMTKTLRLAGRSE